MMKRSWVRGLGVFWVGTLAFAACSDNSTPSSGNAGGDPSEEQGGSAGTLAGQGGSGADAGRDGTPPGGAGGQGGEGGASELRDACGPYPLSDICSDRPTSCPDSANDFSPDACPFSEVKRYASSCGGAVVQSVSDQAVTTWTFEADDRLTGLVVTGDLGTPCKEGGTSFTVVYGEPCEASGEGEVLCSGADGTGGAGGAGGVGGAGGSP